MTQAVDYPVSTWDLAASPQPLHHLWQSTIGALPGYSLPFEKFHPLLTAPSARVFTISFENQLQGFAITYLIRSGSATNHKGQYLKGSIAAIIVAPTVRRKGIGSALHAAAWAHLHDKVCESFQLATPPAKSSQIQLGSIFPRIFPGLPEGPEFSDAVRFFQTLGWTFKEEVSIDLYRSVDNTYEVPDALLVKPTSHGITFASPRPEDDESLYKFQKAEFDESTGWPDMYPALIKAGRRQDITCAFAADRTVIGATTCCLAPQEGDQESPLHALLAWPSTLGKSCGAIACVGVSAKSRNTGTGLAMVAVALKSLADRGADGCFVDWVSLQGWYERLGFVKWNRGYHDSWRTITAELSASSLATEYNGDLSGDV